MFDSWIKIVVIFIVYIFTVFLAFFILASPIDSIIDGFAGVNTPHYQAEYDNQISITSTVLTFFFALFLGLPFAWLVGTVFSREAAFNIRRRYP